MLRKIDLGLKYENTLAYRWEGDFDKEAFDRAMNEFLPEMKSRDRFNIYIEVVDIGGLDANAVWKDVKFYATNAKELAKKIDKIALVTDNSWLKNLAETSYKLIPGIELKAYHLKEQEVAREWVNK